MNSKIFEQIKNSIIMNCGIFRDNYNCKNAFDIQ